MDKQNVVDTYTGISFSLRKEGNYDRSYHTDEPQRHYAESGQSKEATCYVT